MDSQNDVQDLIVKAQAGDRDALDRAIAVYRGGLEKFVRARIGEHLRQEVSVEDVLQETCVEVLKTIARFRWIGERSFLRWMKGIAEHVILNHARQLRKGPIVYIEHDVAGTGPGPETSLRRRDRLERLQEVLDALPPDYRSAVYLVRIEGLQVKEAARRMDRTPKAVTHLLARALKKLRETLGDMESLNLPAGRLLRKEEDDERR